MNAGEFYEFFKDSAVDNNSTNALPNGPDVILRWGVLMSMSKFQLLELYHAGKQLNKKIYFQSKEGLWLLDNKGDLTLQ